MSGQTKSRRGRGRGQIVRGYPRPARLNLPAAGSRPPGGLPDPIPEAALYPVVARWLVDQGFSCWRDVSYLGRWIDLYAQNGAGATVAIELKVMDWKRALAQARLVRPSATWTFIGLWAPYVHRAETPEAIKALSGAGIGLLSINGACTVVLDAPEGDANYRRWVKTPSRASHKPQQ
jgi:hypothetical protein